MLVSGHNRQHQRNEQMADNDDGEPGGGVIGADMAKSFAAGRTIFHLLEIGAEQLAFAATGAAAQKGLTGGSLEIDHVAHDGEI